MSPQVLRASAPRMLPTMSASHHLHSTTGGSRLSRSSAAATGCAAPPAASPAVPPAASSAAPTADDSCGVRAVPAVAAATSADACSPHERSFSPRGKRAAECRRAPRLRHSRSFSGDFPTFHAIAPRSPAHSAIPASNSPLSRRPREDPVETAAYPGDGTCSPASPVSGGEFFAQSGDTANGARLSAQRWSLPPGTSVDGGVGMGDCPLTGGLSGSGPGSSGGADVAFLTSQSPRIDLLRRLKMEAAVAASSCDSPSFFSPSHAAASTGARDSFFLFERQGSIGLLSDGSCDLGDDGSGSFFRVPAKGSAGETFSNLFRLRGVLGSRGSGSGDSGSFGGGSGSFSNGGGSGSLNGGGSGSFSCGVTVGGTNLGGRGGSARRVSISEEDFWAAVRYSDDGDSHPGPPPYPSHHSHPPYNHTRDSHQLDANTRAHQLPEELVPPQRVTSITVIARTVSPLVGAPVSPLPAPAPAAAAAAATAGEVATGGVEGCAANSAAAASPPAPPSLPVSPVDDGPAAAFLEASCNPAEPLTDATSAAADPSHSTSGAARGTVVSKAIATARFATSTSTGSSSGSHVSNSTWTTVVTNLSHESSSSERASSRLSSGLDGEVDGAYDAGNGSGNGGYVQESSNGFGGDTWTGAELSSAESSPRLSPSSPGFFSPSRRSFSHQQDPFQHNSLQGLLLDAKDDDVGNDADGIEIGAVDWHHSHRFYSEYQQPQHYSRQQQQQPPRGRYGVRLGAVQVQGTRNRVQHWQGKKSTEEQEQEEDGEQVDEEEVEEEIEQDEREKEEQQLHVVSHSSRDGSFRTEEQQQQLQAAGGEEFLISEAPTAGSTEEIEAELTVAAAAAGTRVFARTRKYRERASGVVFIPPSDAPEATQAPDSPRERPLARASKRWDGTSGLVFVPVSDPFASADEICFVSSSSPSAVTTCAESDEVVFTEDVEEEGAATPTTGGTSGCRRSKGAFLKRTLSSVVLKQKDPGSLVGAGKSKWWRQLLGKNAT